MIRKKARDQVPISGYQDTNKTLARSEMILQKPSVTETEHHTSQIVLWEVKTQKPVFLSSLYYYYTAVARMLIQPQQ